MKPVYFVRIFIFRLFFHAANLDVVTEEEDETAEDNASEVGKLFHEVWTFLPIFVISKVSYRISRP